MRICFFAKPDAPQTRRLVAGLAERGAGIHVVYHGPGEVPGASYASFVVPGRSLGHPRGWAARQRAYLESFLRDFDVVSVQFLHSWGFTPEMMTAGRFTVRPWGSDICPPPGGPQPRPDTLERRKTMLRCAHAVAVTCRTFRDEVARFAGMKPAGIDCIPLGVDVERFRPRPGIASRPERIVGFFKGFGHAYGAEHFVRAMPPIVAAVPGVRFVLVGDGPLKARCTALVDALGVAEHVQWLPRVAHERVPQTIGGWSVSVIPSIRESFGVAALESSAMGIAVVASRVGGLQETVIDGRTGVLVPPEDSAALASAVIDLLLDEDRRRALGAAGRLFVEEHFDERDCHDRWHRYYERLAASCPVPA